MNSKIISETEYLFNRDFYDTTLSEAEEEEYEERAEELIASYPWEDIFTCWFDYLKKNCHNELAVINWANLFFFYGGADMPIENPYDFLGYLYSKVDTYKYVEDGQHIFDSIVISILEPLGYIDLIEDPYYAPEKDHNIIKAKEKWLNI